MPNNSDRPMDCSGTPLEEVQLKRLPTLPIIERMQEQKSEGCGMGVVMRGGSPHSREKGAATVLCLVCDAAKHTVTLCQNSENCNPKG